MFLKNKPDPQTPNPKRKEWDVPAGLTKGEAESEKTDLLVVHVFISVKVFLRSL